MSLSRDSNLTASDLDEILTAEEQQALFRIAPYVRDVSVRNFLKMTPAEIQCLPHIGVKNMAVLRELQRRIQTKLDEQELV